MKFRMQVGVMDCLSYGNCMDVCPGNPKAGGPALKMVPLEGELGEAANWEYCVKNVKTKQALVDPSKWKNESTLTTSREYSRHPSRLVSQAIVTTYVCQVVKFVKCFSKM